jgi:REP-associated tyrosine transposase
MANTYSQIYIQVVFAVSGRRSLISKAFNEPLHKYIGGFFRKRSDKLIAINGTADHLHLLIGLQPNIALSDLVKELKSASSRHINDKRWVRGHFNWQEGFGAFSYSQSELSRVVRYIDNQEKHHAGRSFRDEYLALLNRFQIEHDAKYLFKWIE